MEKGTPEFVCKVREGFYDPYDEECEKCYWKTQRLCSIFAIEMGLISPVEIMIGEAIKKKELQHERKDDV